MLIIAVGNRRENVVFTKAIKVGAKGGIAFFSTFSTRYGFKFMSVTLKHMKSVVFFVFIFGSSFGCFISSACFVLYNIKIIILMTPSLLSRLKLSFIHDKMRKFSFYTEISNRVFWHFECLGKDLLAVFCETENQLHTR